MLKTLKAYASYNPPYTLPPKDAEITGIYGTVIFKDGSRLPVRVLYVETPFKDKNEKVVIVRGLYPNDTPFEIDRKQLVFIQVFAILGGR